MAIAYVGEKATKATGNGSGTTEVITLAWGCTAGNTVVLCFGARAMSTLGVGRWGNGL